VVPRPESGVTAEGILAAGREHLAAYKAPRIVYLVDDLPRTRNGKLQRRALRPEAARARASGGPPARGGPVSANSPVDPDALTGDPARVVGREERHDVGDVRRLAEAAQWRPLDEHRPHLRGEEGARLVEHAGLRDPDEDRVDGDAARTELVGEHQRELLEG